MDVRCGFRCGFTAGMNGRVITESKGGSNSISGSSSTHGGEGAEGVRGKGHMQRHPSSGLIAFRATDRAAE